ncbi:MAG: alpha/beta hydrolase [Solirubrobacteraceae bacterium]
MAERFAHISDSIELCYETFGDHARPAMLLIMGLGSQMLNWDPEFCELLVAEGYFVVRFDNRDAGRSSRGQGTADLAAAYAGSAPYTLSEMAADAVGLLDALGLERAHIVGASMGGMIAQTLTIEHPARALSLCSIMSTTGAPGVGTPHQEIAWVLTERRPADRDGVARHHLKIWQAIGSPGFPLDEERILRRGYATFDRGLSAAGYMRQLAAVVAQPDRTPALGDLQIPVLVIHGREDPLVDVSGGEATAAAVPGAQLELIDGMGHDLPQPLWPRIVSAIAANAR